MDRYHRNNNSGGNQRRRYSRSRSRERNREQNFRRRNSRSRSRERDNRDNRHQMYNNRYQNQDLYRDIIEDDYYQDNRNNYNSRGGGSGGGGNYDNRALSNRGGREYDHRRDRDRERNRERGDRDRDRRDYRQTGDNGGRNNERRYNSAERGDSDESEYPVAHRQPTNTVLVSGLKPHITEADIMSILIQANIPVSAIHLNRRPNTGASRGFAFVVFNLVESAALWMEMTQGYLVFPDQSCANLKYVRLSDWYCVKCGFSNFNRRLSCYKCESPREESEIGTAEGRDEVSYIVTKKIMLRNLDALTNEDAVLMAMQKHAPDLAKQINKVLISRDPLTQTSRGLCYLHFDSLVDSMNLRNLLAGLDPPLRIDDREVAISYCMDRENREIVPKNNANAATSSTAISGAAPSPAAVSTVGVTPAIVQQYTLDDVPRLAEYSASLYATTPSEQAHYLKYYTDYYISEINKGNFGSLPTDSQIDEYSANSGAAVALSAIQRKQKKMDSIQTTATQAAQAAAQAVAAAKAAVFAAQQQTPAIATPKGNDGKTYPTPDVSLYQYDETSGYYYDPTTGLYYDAHSQYYYNNETGAYLYWDQRKSTYVLATPATVAASVQDVVRQENADDAAKATAAAAAGGKDDEQKKDKKDNDKHDKVKVAKKIVKDMEKWAKQLNQKKDYTAVATPQPILPAKGDESAPRAQILGNSYADVGFSILEKKERVKLTDFLPSTSGPANKLVSTYGSDSDDDKPGTTAAAAAMKMSAGGTTTEASEKDYVDFQKLTCLLCQRAFQSAEILQKHLKMSNLHKENLQKFTLAQAANVTSDDSEAGFSGGMSYRDRAKERRLKYGESDPPPNRVRERFENEMKSLASRTAEAAPPMPISSNNVGNRLLQKMGWSEGQGLGRSNQGRTNIIETEARSSTAGLGIKGGKQGGNSYKTYIKQMMKTRYESV